MRVHSSVAPFLTGAALPAAIFLWPYVRSHSLPAFFAGVFILPAKRMAGAFMVPPPMATRLPLVALVCLTVLLMKSRGWLRHAGSALFAALLAVLLAVSFRHAPTYRLVWQTAESVIPLLVLLVVARLLGYPRSLPPLAAPHQERLLLLAGAASLCALVRFPFAAEIYFCYVAPLVVLTGAAFLGTIPTLPRAARVTLGAYYLVFVVFLFAPGFLDDMGKEYGPDLQTVTLDLARAGRLRVSPETAGVYERLIPLVREHAAGGGILAGPDCPEVYFLAAKRNPTPMLFDFFAEERVRERQLLRLAGDQVIGRLAEIFLVDMDLLEGFRVHEVVGVALVVEVLELHLVHDGPLDELLGAEPVIHDRAGAQVFHLGLHGAALIARGAVLGAEHGEELALVLDDHTGPKLCGLNVAHNFPCSAPTVALRIFLQAAPSIEGG